VTDVVNGRLGPDAAETRKNATESFPVMRVENSDANRDGWVLDDLLESGERSAPDARPAAQALTLPIPQPAWTSRRMGSAVPATPVRAAAPTFTRAPETRAPTWTPSPAWTPAPAQAPGEDAPRERRTALLRAVPAEAPSAVRTAAEAAPEAVRAAVSPPLPDPGAPVLPVPPRDDEKFRYVRRNAWLLTVFSVASFPLLLFSQIRMMIQYHWFLIYSPFVLLAALFLALPLITDGLSRKFDFDGHRRLVDSWHPETYPSVDVFLPVCGEPLEVLRNTWTYVAAMGEHYQGTVTPYVLDDSHSPELKQMAKEFGFAYATRPNRGWFKKSGNLWFGFQVSYGDYILLLDADFAPRHDLLDETLPYMAAYPDIGIVQTPQFFRITDDQTWVERGAGAVQELFYRSIQPARSRKGGSICVGSCAVYRRTALHDNLGMTLAEHSEDVLTGFDLNSKGWKLSYIPVALSTGNCPDNVLAFLNQQYRWCSGTVGLLFGKRFWSARLPLYSRLCYISGLVYYIYTALFTFLVPALTIAILVFVPNVLLLKNMIFMVPVVFYSAVIIPSWHHAPYRLEAWAVRLISGWAHLFAYWDAARGKRLGWKPSGGDSKKQDGRRRFWACFIVWTVGSSLVWTGLAFWRMVTMNPYNFIVLFGLGLFELVIAARVLLQPATDGAA
jgi:cellulose synthase (UDP-forming)